MARTVLVTGGSSGIGLALSHRFAARGDRLLWVARTPPELDAGAETLRATHPDVDLSVLAADLTTDAGVRAVVDWVEGQEAPLDVLVNCAGFASWGWFDAIPEDRDLAMFQLNMIAPYRLMRAFLPAMRARRSGVIVNVASSAGILHSPGFVAYGATKAFLRFLSLALAMELTAEGAGVRCVAVCPAAVKDTAFQAEAGMQGTSIFDNGLATTPDEVADDVMRGLEAGKAEVLTGRVLRLALPLLTRLPRSALGRRIVTELEAR